MERYVAIDDVCAWPNLTLLPNGDIVALLFDQPCHGGWEGDVACWASDDGGHLWTKRGDVSAHAPGTVRMNHAAGVAHDGALLALVSGYDHKAPRGQQPPEGASQFLPAEACRSYDGGRNWQRAQSVCLPQGYHQLIPFGDIVQGPEGVLAAALYSFESRQVNDALVLFSSDDGHTWRESALIGAADYNETALTVLQDGAWLAAIRTVRDAHLALFSSRDLGRTWTMRGDLSLPNQHPGHLLQLADGRVLLTLGLRNPGLAGVGVRLSGDGGQTWGALSVLVTLDDARDAGYPTSVQLADGTVVTAYYASGVQTHMRYHMGVLRWQVP